MEPIVNKGWFLDGWVFSSSDWDEYRADPTDVDPLPIQAVALAIDALDIHADGSERLDHLRFGVGSQVVIAHAVML